ncbi:MAG: hypothetical protein MUO26_12175 [Methanotrichaceae archaeon]|nr:hypothetical protein [Methanotrichaceae archaeon]
MRRTVLVLTSLCLIVVMGLSIAAEPPKSEVLNSFKGNLSENRNLDLLTMAQLFGLNGLNLGETVKLKAPKPNWTLRGIEIAGYDGFNGSRESLPSPEIIALEIRDKDLNLLYKYADSQLPYSNLWRNSTGPVVMRFELPPTRVTDEFYIVFYDRNAVQVMAELNSTGDSYFFNPYGKTKLEPAEVVQIKDNKTIPINWIMTAVGI